MQAQHRQLISDQASSWLDVVRLPDAVHSWASGLLADEMEYVLSGEDNRSFPMRYKALASIKGKGLNEWDLRGLLLVAGIEAIGPLRTILAEDAHIRNTIRIIPPDFPSIPTVLAVGMALLAELKYAEGVEGEDAPANQLSDVWAEEAGKALSLLQMVPPEQHLDQARERPEYLLHLKDEVVWQSILELFASDGRYRQFAHKHGYPTQAGVWS